MTDDCTVAQIAKRLSLKRAGLPCTPQRIPTIRAYDVTFVRRDASVGISTITITDMPRWVMEHPGHIITRLIPRWSVGHG